MTEVTRYREVPGLHITRAIVRWNITDLRVCGIESSRGGEVIGKAQVGGPETSAGRVIDRSASASPLAGQLIDHGVYNVGPVIGEQVLAAHAVELDVADSVGAANDRFGIDLISHADAGRPVVRIGMHQRAVVETATGSQDHLARSGVEV